MPSFAERWIVLKILGHFDREIERWVAGSPELHVWSSGQTPQEAVERANEAVLLFLDEATRLGTVWRILEEAGVELHRDPPRSTGTPGLLDRLRTSAFIPAVFAVRAPSEAHG